MTVVHLNANYQSTSEAHCLGSESNLLNKFGCWHALSHSIRSLSLSAWRLCWYSKSVRHIAHSASPGLNVWSPASQRCYITESYCPYTAFSIIILAYSLPLYSVSLPVCLKTLLIFKVCMAYSTFRLWILKNKELSKLNKNKSSGPDGIPVKISRPAQNIYKILSVFS